jgi:FKBP-type peptidyl-prolyl cis-trans isomerase 2
VKIGDTIQVEYTGRLEDGTVFDSSDRHDEPLEFTVGDGKLIEGFENAVVGMELGEEKEVTIQPEEGYGPYNPDLVRDIPRKIFPEDKEIQAGMVFVMALQNGKRIPVRISGVEGERVTVDLNSPLAGKTLVFTIKIVDIAS